jgi:hypothetical protein
VRCHLCRHVWWRTLKLLSWPRDAPGVAGILGSVEACSRLRVSRPEPHRLGTARSISIHRDWPCLVSSVLGAVIVGVVSNPRGGPVNAVSCLVLDLATPRLASPRWLGGEPDPDFYVDQGIDDSAAHTAPVRVASSPERSDRPMSVFIYSSLTMSPSSARHL